MTHNKGGSVPDGLHGNARPPSRSNRLQTGKESWALNDLSKAEETWPKRQRCGSQEATTRMRTSCAVTGGSGGSELRSMGITGTVYLCLQGLRVSVNEHSRGW